MTNVELDRTVNEVILDAIEAIWIRFSRHVTAPLFMLSSSSTAQECISSSLSLLKFILTNGNSQYTDSYITFNKVCPFTKHAALSFGCTQFISHIIFNFCSFQHFSRTKQRLQKLCGIFKVNVSCFVCLSSIVGSSMNIRLKQFLSCYKTIYFAS